MERPRPGSHFARIRSRSRMRACAQEHNNCVRCAHTCVHKRLLKVSSVRAGVETPGGWGEGPWQRLSLFIRRWKHTHTHLHTHSGPSCKCHSGLRWWLCWLCTSGGCRRGKRLHPVTRGLRAGSRLVPQKLNFERFSKLYGRFIHGSL